MIKRKYCGAPYGCVEVIDSKRRYIKVNIADKILTSTKKHKRKKYDEFKRSTYTVRFQTRFLCNV
jgi:hypothetical protein